MEQADLAACIAFVGLGLGLGARHAFEPDHLAAIGVLSTQAPGVRRAALLGAAWGIGHTLALLAVGCVLAALSASMPVRLGAALELVVAAMLIAMGARAIARAIQAGAATPGTRDDAAGTGCAGDRARLCTPSLLVGMVHGLAGSGALTAFVVAELPDGSARIGFMALFGIGSLVGMAVSSGIAGFPLARLARRPATARWVGACAGLLSAGLGVSWAAPLLQHVFM
jgi:hypothetical protein